MLDRELIALDVEGLRAERRLGVVLHTGRTLSNAAQAMLEILHDVADQSGGAG